jgi:hypothetical protein
MWGYPRPPGALRDIERNAAISAHVGSIMESDPVRDCARGDSARYSEARFNSRAWSIPNDSA